MSFRPGGCCELLEVQVMLQRPGPAKVLRGTEEGSPEVAVMQQGSAAACHAGDKPSLLCKFRIAARCMPRAACRPS